MKRLTGTIVLTLLLTVFMPSAANAHQGNADYKSEITSIIPAGAADGLQMEIGNFDDHVEMINRTGKEVVVKGYDGEPYFRIGADGLVEVNLNSPSYYLNEDRFADVEVPARADAKAAPEWEEVDDTGIYVWHDHRSHYMGLGTPSQVKDESEKTKVFDYSIPLTVGGVPVKANGALTWVGKQSGPPFFIWILLAGLIVAGAVGVGVMRKRREHEEENAVTPQHETPEAVTDQTPDPAPEKEPEAW